MKRICQSIPNAEGVHIHDEYPLSTALLHALGLVDPSFDFCQVRYLETKNEVDRASINPEIWNDRVIFHLRTISNGTIRIVDVGAGLLSMLEVLLYGDSENGLQSLDARIEYTAFESNHALYNACHQRLLEWGFTLLEAVSEEEFLYQRQNVQVRFFIEDFDSHYGGPAPNLIVGCCFADLIDPAVLVPSLIQSFNLLDSKDTLLYFPITFCGITQFLPPKPFETPDSDSMTIPSDTAAFQVYSKALTETLGHNLDPNLFQQAMEDHGATLLAKGSSDWKIDPKLHPYLFDTMIYFFGTAGGPQLLQEGWDTSGWIDRAKQNRPNIQVSNMDLLFRMGQHKVKQPSDSKNTYTEIQEILFTEPQKVSTTQKPIPDVGPNQVLSKFGLLLSCFNFQIMQLTPQMDISRIIIFSY